MPAAPPYAEPAVSALTHARAMLRLATLIAWLALCLIGHGLWRMVRAPSPWPRWFLGTSARIFGASPRVIGTPLRRDVVFLSNHLSWLDILLLAGASGTAFVAKAELQGVPLVGWLCTLNRTIFVRRADRMAVTQQVADLRAALADSWAVAMFPEGTTSDGVTLLPFKAALLAALDPPPPGLMIQPVRIDYGDATRDLAWVGDEPGQHHALRVLRRAGRFTATLRFLEPFAPMGDRKAIAAEARARIEAAG
jgi:1-acyl-sn-glycerol-3-phosphate acyltransferase